MGKFLFGTSNATYRSGLLVPMQQLGHKVALDRLVTYESKDLDLKGELSACFYARDCDFNHCRIAAHGILMLVYTVQG